MTQPQAAPQPSPRPFRRHLRLWLAGLLALVLLVSGAFYGGLAFGRKYSVSVLDPLWLRAYLNRPADHTTPLPGFWVAGYYVDYDQNSLTVAAGRADQMDQVIIFGYSFDEQGNVQGKDESIMKGVTGQQKRILLFGNNFDQKITRALFSVPAAQDQAIKGILAKCEEMQAAGVQIDFEDMPNSDRAAFTAFLKRLKEKLSAQKLTLSVAVAAKTTDSPAEWGAFDYQAIGQIADYVYLMSYDEHWKGGDPGPVASLSWTERVVRYATGVIPAQKIMLGVPLYGYEWSVDPKGAKTNKATSSAQMPARVAQYGGTIQWNSIAGENMANFATPDGARIAWYPDQRSLDDKLKLAYQYNLKGVSLWRLGFEPEDWWNDLGTFRQNPAK